MGFRRWASAESLGWTSVAVERSSSRERRERGEAPRECCGLGRDVGESGAGTGQI